MMTDSHRTVLYVDNSYTFGGAINALEHLLAATDGLRPIILSAQPEEVLRRQFPRITTQHWPVRLSWVHNSWHQRILRWPGFQSGPLRYLWSKLRALYWIALVDVPEALRVMRFAQRHNVQLVHLNNGVDGMLPALLAAKLLRLPVIAHARGPISPRGIARVYAHAVTRWIAVSGGIARNVADAGVSQAQIDTIHDAIDLKRFAMGAPPPELRSALGIPEEAPVFGIFGRIVDWKGIKEFVQAANVVFRECPTAYALVVGDASDGAQEYFREVVRLSEELGINDRLIFTGFREDVADLMRLCEVVVHASIDPEPFGMIVIEAMATGAAVVAANAGGPTEIISSEEYGTLVDPTDTEQLAGAIVRLLSDSELAAQIGRNAARRVREHFSAQRYAYDVECVYEKIGNGKQR